eukprot:1147544-Pelagomonas_calceolata.AAC.2
MTRCIPSIPCPSISGSGFSKVRVVLLILTCRFMKLRLDRVLRFDLGPIADSEALAVGGKVPEFKKPEKWTAPYPGYTPGWWEKFIPQ